MDEFPAGTPRKSGTVSLPPRKVKGWVHEVKVPLAKGEAVRYETCHDLGAGVVEFNIHSHQGPTVTYHARDDRPRSSGTFPAPWTGDFYLMWENTSERAVPVAYVLERATPAGRP